MSYMVCSKEFKEFWDKIPDNLTSAEEMIRVIGESIGPLAKSVNIGQIELELSAPATIFVRDGIHVNLKVYTAPKGYQDSWIADEFETGEKGSCIIITYPVKGHAFTEEEQNAIHFIASAIYRHAGRARMAGLLRQAALTDSMTGVYNTSGLRSFGAELAAKRELKNYDGIFVNLKNFNYINKMITSRQGDEVLQKYAQTVQSFIQPDEVFARLGGDNFFALIKKERIQDFLKFTADVEVTVEFGGTLKVFHVTARMGIYSMSERDTMVEAMNNTSMALNAAKNSAKDDVVWFRQEMAEQMIHQKMISSMFPQAIANQEFVVYYQPKVTLEDSRLCACEALVRWIRNGNLIPPMEFIPVLEKEGTVCALDFYVFERVCQDIRGWLDAGIEPVCTSVNFSKLHLHDENLAKTILDTMDRYQIESKYIEIELTEMSGYENYTALEEFVHIIKEKGIRTSIDDFGTGYSSLNMLKDISADIIKLDKSFLDNLEQENSKPDEIVIKNIVNMINELDMEAIAEGVETKRQADFLRKVHCRMAQGDLYDRPLPHDEFEQRLIKKRVYNL